MFLGNEASDADSVVSPIVAALATACAMNMKASTGGAAAAENPWCLPVMSISRKELRLRRDVEALLRRAGVDAGDVVFWHPRLVHGPGINYSAEHDEPVVRYIVPCEYQKDGLTSYFNLSHGPAPNRQWWVDTKNFREDVPATDDNIWDVWAFTSSS